MKISKKEWKALNNTLAAHEAVLVTATELFQREEQRLARTNGALAETTHAVRVLERKVEDLERLAREGTGIPDVDAPTDDELPPMTILSGEEVRRVIFGAE